VLALLTPGPFSATFNGLPLSNPAEVAAAGVVIAVLVSRSLCNWLRAIIFDNTSRRRVWVTSLSLVIVLKVSLFVLIPTDGRFEGCYRGYSPAGLDADCSVSFENLWKIHRATRFDPAIDFGPTGPSATTIEGSNWDLGMVNDTRFNVFGSDPNLVDYTRFPFQATWTADIDTSEDVEVAIEYVGEVTSVVDGETSLKLTEQ
jgi:hypothetical protein